jgi:hypothetical protein
VNYEQPRFFTAFALVTGNDLVIEESKLSAHVSPMPPIAPWTDYKHMRASLEDARDNWSSQLFCCSGS